MKKIISTVLAVVCMAAFMIACSSSSVDTAAVENELVSGTWAGTIDSDNSVIWTFADGKVSAKNVFNGEEFAPDEGTYKVNTDNISLTWNDPENNRIDALYFNYENGSLSLFMDAEKEAQLVRQ